MVKRGKRIVSKILCATVLFTMTAVPGAVFAESDEALEAADTGSKAVETEAPDSANEAAQTEQKETAPAAQKEEAKAPAQESQAAPQTQVKAAKSQTKAVAPYYATGVSIGKSPSRNTYCNGETVTLTANIADKSSHRDYTYQWYKNGAIIQGATKSQYQATTAGSYFVKVVEDRHIVSDVTLTSSAVSLAFAEHNIVWSNKGSQHQQCCSRCEKTFSALEDHDPAYKIANDTTKHIKYCKKCNANLETATEHAYGEFVETKKPNCTETGLKVRTCTDCGAKDEATIDAAGHTWEADYTVDQEPTCTTAGSKSKHCEKCDATTDVTTIPATGHKMTKTEAKAATCTASGNNEYYTCKTCNLVFKDEAGTTPTTAAAEITEPIAHDLTKTEAKPATCTENGHKAYWTCGSCGQLFADENGKTAIEKPEVIEATGHTLNLVPQKDATCTEEGYEAYWKCDVCDHMFTSKEASEALDAPVVIPATGHKLGDWKVVKEPTLEEAGMKERVCEKCDYAEIEAIPALDAAKTDLTGKTELNKTKETADKSDDSAKTGDDMNVTLYSLLALLAASGAVGVAYRRRTTEK